MKKIYTLLLLACGLQVAAQQKDPVGIRAIGTPPNPKVQVAWNRYYDYKGLLDIMQRMVKAYPDLAKLESIGKSQQGRDIYVLTITNLKSAKSDRQKPAFWTDANIHSNELQGSEMTLYAAWYLTENYASNAFIRELVNDRTFYFAPTINPDAREDFIYNANTANTPRSGMTPIDDDGDGLVDEDNFDDLNGDGEITFMRRKSPQGRLKVNPDDPRMLIPAKPDEPGEYELLGYEGLDNDGDGLINEDRPGSYDPNRDWAWNWQPDYIQGGAYKYPFSLPEPRVIMEWIMKHPNIGGAQSYHNFSGMFLRGPGAAEDDAYYEPADVAVYDFIGKTGEKMIPTYQYGAIHKILYTVYGGEIDWFALGRGIFMFSNELWTSYLYFNKKGEANELRNAPSTEPYDFDRLLLHGDAFVDWKPFKHPQYGDIEIGGFKKNYIRNHPGFILETDGHRNAAFTLFHANQLPKIEIGQVTKKELGNGLTEITAVISNKRIIPTHSAFDVRNKINPADKVTLKDAQVVSGLQMINPDGGGGFGAGTFESFQEQKRTPQTLEVANIPGMGYVKVRWIVKGNPSSWSIEVDSQKGGFTTGTGKF
ncbi:M14 family metallopeptidase [Siphonobacter aquaeclarae]|nr:M14 family metallopeptidase [Siphonobacter aquaeclarae]